MAKAAIRRLRSRWCNAIATPGVEINKIFRLVRDDVMEATAGRQSVHLWLAAGKEDFFFVVSK